jgi:hypothetical protein
MKKHNIKRSLFAATVNTEPEAGNFNQLITKMVDKAMVQMKEYTLAQATRIAQLEAENKELRERLGEKAEELTNMLFAEAKQ